METSTKTAFDASENALQLVIAYDDHVSPKLAGILRRSYVWGLTKDKEPELANDRTRWEMQSCKYFDSAEAAVKDFHQKRDLMRKSFAELKFQPTKALIQEVQRRHGASLIMVAGEPGSSGHGGLGATPYVNGPPLLLMGLLNFAQATIQPAIVQMIQQAGPPLDLTNDGTEDGTGVL